MYMLGEDKQQNHIKWSVTTKEGKEVNKQRQKKSGRQNGNKEQSIDQKTVTNMLSQFSRVRLCATPQTAAHQVPPSLGFSRQEYWSGVPLPSPLLITREMQIKAMRYHLIPFRMTYCRKQKTQPTKNRKQQMLMRM